MAVGRRGEGEEPELAGLQVGPALHAAPHPRSSGATDEMTEIIPVYAISVDSTIREEAVQVLFRTVKDLPPCRLPILRGMAKGAILKNTGNGCPR